MCTVSCKCIVRLATLISWISCICESYFWHFFSLLFIYTFTVSAILFMMEPRDTNTCLASVNTCYYCQCSTKQFAEVIMTISWIIIIHHPASELTYTIIADVNTTQPYKTNNFRIYWQHIQDSGKCIIANSKNSKNKSISIYPFVNKTSPCKNKHVRWTQRHWRWQ
jgi:hypothetical protein